ncbi:phosphotransferase family protein [Bacillus sp. JJ1533]|uniref:phosphotransferase family protein n=1 Tax=Bacillus sp. JJ1533 TaxID=3122959 RepID=UPI002FFF7406
MRQSQFKNNSPSTEIDWKTIEKYLRSHNIVSNSATLEVEQFSTGYSNLTYQIKIGEWKAVLRRPPFGPLPPKAHDMKREFEILSKLRSVFPLIPKPYLYCEDTSIMDRHFYIMEKIDGIVIDNAMPDEFKDIPESGHLISESVIDTLTKLHQIDYKEVGLEMLGYPEGYLRRQVHGWIKRYNNSKTEKITGIEELEKWLIENIPASSVPTIVHCDYKLNNMMFAKDNPGKIIGLFDWEMSTIGDPLTDVAVMLAYWEQPGDPYTGITSVSREAEYGFATRREMLEMYARKSGRDISNIDYYLAFAFYKVASILQQIYYRWKIGEAKDERFGKLGEGVVNMMELSKLARNKQVL